MSEEHRPFQWTTAEMNAEIDAQLAKLDPGTKLAVIAHADIGGSAVLSVVGRLGDKWTVVAEGYRSFGKSSDFGARAAVRFSL